MRGVTVRAASRVLLQLHLVASRGVGMAGPTAKRRTTNNADDDLQRMIGGGAALPPGNNFGRLLLLCREEALSTGTDGLSAACGVVVALHLQMHLVSLQTTREFS